MDKKLDFNEVSIAELIDGVQEVVNNSEYNGDIDPEAGKFILAVASRFENDFKYLQDVIKSQTTNGG